MRILLIVQPERADFYNYLRAVPDAEWFLLWYEKKGQMTVSAEQLPIAFNEIYYWNQFLTPAALLRKIQPDRIVFFEIIDLRQIALNIVASHKKIPTFYLEHGAAGDRETALIRYDEKGFRDHKLPYLLTRIQTGLIDAIRAKLFYYSVFKGFHTFQSYWKYFSLPFRMLVDGSNKVLHKNIFRERVPMKAIVFNKSNYEEFALYTGLSETDVLLTGVPFFDHYYSNDPSIKDYVVYIDHPYLEEGILDWTAEHHKRIAEALFVFAEQKKTMLYIKLHPRSDRKIWESYKYDKTKVQILQFGDFMDLYLHAKLILGFSSSLITGFLCARKNVLLLGWHPVPHIFCFDFSKTSLCHVSLYYTELNSKYECWVAHNLAEENEAAYHQFLREFNYPFDGKATERVIKAITDAAG